MAKRSRAKSAHPSQPKRATSPSPAWLWIGAAVIAVATFVAYLPSLNGAFILDDILLLTDNRLIKAPDGLFRIWFTSEPFDYWPVFNNSLWVEWRVWGMQPTGYHVTNVILHIADALLVWAILRQLAIPGTGPWKRRLNLKRIGVDA
jgi:protein O-mannosyl-transferase